MSFVQRDEPVQRHMKTQNRAHALMHAGPNMQEDIFRDIYTETHLQNTDLACKIEKYT